MTSRLSTSSGQEEAQTNIRLPTPVPDSIVGLEALVGALLKACSVVEAESAEQFQPTQPRLRTSVIRRIIKENT